MRQKKLTPEGAITKEIRYVLRLYGVMHWKVFQSLGSEKGVSDIIAVEKKTGRIVAIEVKAPRGKLSPAQDNFLKLIEANGGIAIVARSAMDVIQRLGLSPRTNQ
ncbi:MAG TPA: VRR-NUC domain-containing protein [Smithellaceae bacterium]|nr:VRR-NUC domain-containing protein [Smithellaceae bacterium]